MNFISTRGGSPISAGEAILKGISDDGGLYVPSSFPKLTDDDIDNLMEMEYYERAGYILSKYLTDYNSDDLMEYCRRAYARFDSPDPVPVVKVDDNTYMLELMHGPTLAFKDVALTLLPYLMNDARLRAGEKDKMLILVATSGDTGKAALEGFKDVDGTEVIVFYPSEGVSDMQKLQMKTAKGGNVHAVGIEGNFDDAQTAVKKIFTDASMKEKLHAMGYKMSSANSINWGRLAPQIVYYISAWLDMLGTDEITKDDKINFVVPTGNFGNILAAYYAMRMGVPVNKLIVASNKNNVLSEFFNTGVYDVNRQFYKTMSPSMDILISSNLERLLFELFDRDAEKVKDVINDLKVYGKYEIDTDLIEEKLPEFAAYWSDEDDTVEAIANFYDMFDYLVDTHTGVAVSAYYTYVTEENDEDTKTVIAETADPFKFPSDVLYAVNEKREKDAFKAVEKLESYTMLTAPNAIKELKSLPITQDIVIPKTKIGDTILEILDKKQK